MARRNTFNEKKDKKVYQITNNKLKSAKQQHKQYVQEQQHIKQICQDISRLSRSNADNLFAIKYDALLDKWQKLEMYSS